MSQLKDRFSAVRVVGVGVLASVLAGGVVSAQPNIGPPVRVDTNGGTEAANETSIATTDFRPNEIVATWNDWRNSTGSEVINMGVGVSLDGGLTWDDFHVRPPGPNQSGVEGDPMTAYDNRTGTIWVGAISFASNGGLFVAKKIPGSVNFEPSVQVGQRSFADKCWMVAGPAPGNPDATMVYIAYNEGVWRSSDMGQSWQGPVSAGSGIGFLPRIAPNGDLFVSYWDFGNGHWIRRSTNGGLSFGARVKIATRMDVWGTQDGSRFPGLFRMPSMNTLAIDPNNGTLYAVYPDTTSNHSNGRNVDLYFTKSTDSGSSWSTPVVINDDPATPGDQFFAWLEVDQNSMLHMVYYDSSNTVQNDNTPNGMFDAYYRYSDDGGSSWSEARLTAAPFNSINDGLDRGSSQFIGDYLGLGVGGNKVYPCYLSTASGDSDIFVHSITTGNAGMNLSTPVPGRVGQDNTLTATNAEAGDKVIFMYGFRPGSTNVNGCPGLVVDIRNPKVLGSSTANGSGTAELQFFVPNRAAGVTVHFQAGQLTTCEKSNVAVYTF